MAIGRDAVFIARPCRLILLRELAGEACRVTGVTASVIGDHIGMSTQDSSPTFGLAGKKSPERRRQLLRCLPAFHPFINCGEVVRAIRSRTDHAMRDARPEKQPDIIVRRRVLAEYILVVL